MQGPSRTSKGLRLRALAVAIIHRPLASDPQVRMQESTDALEHTPGNTESAEDLLCRLRMPKQRGGERDTAFLFAEGGES